MQKLFNQLIHLALIPLVTGVISGFLILKYQNRDETLGYLGLVKNEISTVKSNLDHYKLYADESNCFSPRYQNQLPISSWSTTQLPMYRILNRDNGAIKKFYKSVEQYKQQLDELIIIALAGSHPDAGFCKALKVKLLETANLAASATESANAIEGELVNSKFYEFLNFFLKFKFYMLATKLPVIAVLLNFVGTIFVAFSIGKLLRGGRTFFSAQDGEKKSYDFAYVLHPLWFRIGLSIIALGFLIQIIVLF